MESVTKEQTVAVARSNFRGTWNNEEIIRQGVYLGSP